jgi:xanthine/CO dehydrogenase XdhC/CoxF family maturation factor
VLVTIFHNDGIDGAPVGAHLMINNDGTTRDRIDNDGVAAYLSVEGNRGLESGRTNICTFQSGERSLTALVEWIELPVPLCIFGAGPDAVPLVRFAKQLGWNVTVVDRRPAFARPDRFPGADAVVLCEPQELSQQISLQKETVAVVMTHHFETDAKYLKELLQSPVSYIGILGPKSKSEMLLHTVQEEGLNPTREQLSRIFGPVGLDLGAETPEEIALAIVAEIQAVKTSHPSGFLRDRSQPIHRQTL